MAGAGCSLVGRAHYLENSRPEPRPGGPRGAGASWEVWGPLEGARGLGATAHSWEMVGSRGHTISIGELGAGGGALRRAPRFKLQRERESGRGGECLGGLGGGVE